MKKRGKAKINASQTHLSVKKAPGVLDAFGLSQAESGDALRIDGIHADVLIQDGSAYHVHTPGKTFAVQVMPMVSGGGNLADCAQVADIRLQVPKQVHIKGSRQPFSLFSTYSHAASYSKENASPDQLVSLISNNLAEKTVRFVELEMTFANPVVVQSGFLRGNIELVLGMIPDRHDLFRPDSCEFIFVGPDRIHSSITPQIRQGFSTWEAMWTTDKPMPAIRMCIRLGLRAALTLDGLHLTGHQISDIDPNCMIRPQATMTCQWTNAKGAALSKPVALKTHRMNRITSPDHLKEGYCELRFAANAPGIMLSHDRYGFMIRKPRIKTDVSVNQDSPFGIIHADIEDPYLDGHWVKSLSLEAGWNPKTGHLNKSVWQNLIIKRLDRGECELPLFTDTAWQSDSTRPISKQKLNALAAKLRQYMRATPQVRAWELGIEENLRWRANRDRWTHYWANLEAKFRTARNVANDVHPDARLIYQVAELDYQSLEDFAKSGVPQYVDILSLHPYAWPDFADPQTWLPEFLRRAQTIMKKHDCIRPIWFTEVGAPHHGNPNGFFGYPQNLKYVQGLDNITCATYLIKTHMVALHAGVEKLFWYNYIDRGYRLDYSEDWFGARSYWGFPKPLYVAWVTMTSLLDKKKIIARKTLPGGIKTYLFRGEKDGCVVTWAGAKPIKLSCPALEKSAGMKVKSVRDITGAPMPIKGKKIFLNEVPVFIKMK